MRIALKRLSASDLSLYRSQFRQRGTSKQKGINLNARVIDGILYPGLRDIVVRAGRLGHSLTLRTFGPAGRPAAPDLKRKVVKSSGSKNLRLNGEVVPDPDGEPGRYDALKKGDFAIMAFDGDTTPTLLNLVLLAIAEPSDKAACDNAAALLGTRSMIALDAAKVLALMKGVAPEHPVARLLDPDVAEDDLISAVEGVAGAVESLKQRRQARPISAEELARARERAAQIGRDGEALVNDWLEAENEAGRISSFRWASDENAVESFDFEVVPGTEMEWWDVKTTTGDFDRPFHISTGEVVACAGAPGPYRVARVWDLEAAPMMQQSGDLRAWATAVIASMDHTPAGVTVDGFTVQPGSLPWEGEPVALVVDDDQDEEEDEEDEAENRPY